MPDLVRVLEVDGWRLRAVRGSHRQFKHPDRAMLVTVAGHPGKDVPVGTLRSILRAAGLRQEGSK